MPRVSSWIWPKRTSGKWRVAEDRWGCHFSQLSGACGVPRSTRIRQCCSTWGRREITLSGHCFPHLWLSPEAGSRPALSHLQAPGQVAPCSLNFSATSLLTSLHPAHICERPHVDLLPGKPMSGRLAGPRFRARTQALRERREGARRRWPVRPGRARGALAHSASGRSRESCVWGARAPVGDFFKKRDGVLQARACRSRPADGFPSTASPRTSGGKFEERACAFSVRGAPLQDWGGGAFTGAERLLFRKLL